MTAFAAFLGDKVERYIDLRRSLGYAFRMILPIRSRSSGAKLAT
ncbi:hypothetical protein ACE103_09760 [Bradyrhizobium sp. ma5]